MVDASDPSDTAAGGSRILDRAQSLYWERGWDGPSLREVETAVGLKAPSIYRRFGDKAGLEAAVLEHYLDRVVQRRVERFLAPEADPAGNLRAFVLSAVTVGTAEQPPGCLLVMAGGAVATKPHLGPGAARGFGQLETALATEVGRLAGAGRLPEGLSAGAVVDRLIVGFVGLLSLARAGERPSVLRRRAEALLDDLGGSDRSG